MLLTRRKPHEIDRLPRALRALPQVAYRAGRLPVITLASTVMPPNGSGPPERCAQGLNAQTLCGRKSYDFLAESQDRPAVRPVESP